MRNVFSTEIRRSITGSIGRFLAIAGIVALGCGFYAGLRMTGIDMRSAGDNFTDGTSLYDIRLVSTLGFSDALVDDIKGIDGVDSVMAGRSTDVMASLGGEQYAVRVSTFPVESANASKVTDGGMTAISDDDSYLNRLVVKSGRLPQSAGECVLSADRVVDSPLNIGDTVEVLYGASDLTDVLDVRSYTVVGFVSSSNYISSTSLGSTTLGSGLLGQYMYVAPESFSQNCPYTEVFVKAAGASAFKNGSDAYQERVDEVKDTISDALPSLCSARQDELKTNAQRQLDDQKVTFESEKASANQQLDESKATLDAAAATLASSRDTLESGESAYEDGVAQLESAESQLPDGGQDALDEANASWQQGLASWQQASDGWYNTQRPQLQSQLDQVQSGIAQTQAGIANIDEQIRQLDPTDPSYEQKKQALEQQRQQLLASLATLQAQESQLKDGIAQGDQSIADAKATLDETKAQLNEWQGGLDAVHEARATLASSRSELDGGWAQLASGRAEYDSGLAEWKAGREEADTRFANAQRDIDDAQALIDDLDAPEVYTLDRTQNYGCVSYKADSERMDKIAAVFPLFFFIVAALVVLTTMTRMVEDDRVEIGTYKALGYSKARISSKYLFYAGITSTVGGLIGILVLSQILPVVIMNAYGIIYNVPAQPFPLQIDAGLALGSLGAGVGITLLATWAAVFASLRESPAALMQPKTPKAGKRILLERITPIWHHMSFTWKVTFRNLFRYKRRLLMTIIGIAGCTGLLLTGLGVRDAINDIIDNQFGSIVHYDSTIGLKDDASEGDVQSVLDYLDSTGDVSNHVRTQSLNKQLGSTSHDSCVVQVSIPRTPMLSEEMVTFRTRTTHDAVALDDSSVVLSEKLAYNLGVGVGDTVELYDQDDVGNATGDPHELVVTGIMENYIGDLVYLGKDAYAATGETAPSYTTVYASITNDPDAREQISNTLHGMSGVNTVTYSDETIATYRTMLKSMDVVMVVLVVSAAALAFIVLFDLTNINVEERIREIATLKVLGFTPHEVNSYIFRETIMLTVLGALVGLPTGVFMEGFVVVTAEVDRIMFGRIIHPISFVWAFLLTLCFAVIVMLAMRRKLRDVDMVESLKSNE